MCILSMLPLVSATTKPSSRGNRRVRELFRLPDATCSGFRHKLRNIWPRTAYSSQQHSAPQSTISRALEAEGIGNLILSLLEGLGTAPCMCSSPLCTTQPIADFKLTVKGQALSGPTSRGLPPSIHVAVQREYKPYILYPISLFWLAMNGKAAQLRLSFIA